MTLKFWSLNFESRTLILMQCKGPPFEGYGEEVTDFRVVVGAESLDLVRSQLPKLFSSCTKARTVTKHGEAALQSVRER